MAQANIRSIRFLTTFKNELVRLGADIRTSLQQQERELHRTQAWLEERHRFWESRVRRAQAEVQQAVTALARCEASGYHDKRTGRYHAPNCEVYEAALRRAWALLEENKTQLAKVTYGIQVLEEASAAYARQIRRIRAFVETELVEAQAYLVRRAEALEAYVVTEVSGRALSVTSTSPQATADMPKSASRGQDETALSSHWLSEGSGRSVGVKKEYPKAYEQLYHPSGPGRIANLTGETPWVDLGIQNVRVADLPEPEDILGADDFKKISEAEMRAGLKRLEEMRPIIESGEGANRDYWEKLDEEQGFTCEKSYCRIYDAFYGKEPICLDKDGDQYDILNGRHRIWLAKRMGIDTLPARVLERRYE